MGRALGIKVQEAMDVDVPTRARMPSDERDLPKAKQVADESLTVTPRAVETTMM